MHRILYILEHLGGKSAECTLVPPPTISLITPLACQETRIATNSYIASNSYLTTNNYYELLASVHEKYEELDSKSPPNRESLYDTSQEELDVLNKFVTTYKNTNGILLATDAELEQFLGAFYNEVVIDDKVRELFAKYHNCINGHGGVERTFYLIRSYFKVQSIRIPSYNVQYV